MNKIGLLYIFYLYQDDLSNKLVPSILTNIILKYTGLTQRY